MWMPKLFLVVIVVISPFCSKSRKTDSPIGGIQKENLIVNTSAEISRVVPGFNDPFVFLIGVQKAATTSLHDLIIQNLQFCKLGEKEKHYFEIDSTYAKGTRHYKSMFEMCKDQGLTIDSTPVFSYPSVPGKIASTYSTNVLRQKKFILILREQVSRDFSYYEHKLRACEDYILGKSKKYVDFAKRSCSNVLKKFDSESKNNTWDPIPFKDYFKRGHVVLEDGQYYQHLRNWLKYLKRDQLFIVSMQTLVQNTSDTMHRIKKFLGLNQPWEKNCTLPRLNGSPRVKASLDCATFDELKKLHNPHNHGLVDFIRRTRRWSTEAYFPDFEDTRSKCIP